MAAEVSKIIYLKFQALFLLLQFSLRTTQSSVLNIEELQNFKYGVEISAEPVLLNSEVKDQSTVRITSKHGQEYQCVLPIVHFQVEEPNEMNITTDEIDALLQPINHTCLTQINGWWTYQVCFGNFIIQYHDDGEDSLILSTKDVINLGNFTGSTDWSTVSLQDETNGAKRYHSQFYGNGTTCDLTGVPRQTEVRFFCNEDTVHDVIARIDETSTCHYVISVHTDKLCKHIVFRGATTPKKHSITCSPALNEAQYTKYTESQRKNQERQLEELSSIKNLGLNDDVSSDVYKTNDVSDTDHEKQKEVELEDQSISESMKDVFSKSSESLRNVAAGRHSKNVDKIDDGDASRLMEDMDKMDDLGVQEEQVRDDMDINDDDVEVERDGDVHLDPFKRKMSFFRSKTKYNEDKSDYYQGLINGLKYQYGFYKKHLNAVTSSMKKRVARLERGIGSVDPTVKSFLQATKKSVEQLENKQSIAEDAMNRLSDLYDAVLEDPDYLKAHEELASIRSTLTGLLKNTERHPSEEVGDSLKEVEKDNTPGREYSKLLQKSQRELDASKPNLDKLVSKLKKIMTENQKPEAQTRDEFQDDHISVRVTNIKDKLYEDKMDFEDGDNHLDEIYESEEMKEATRKMESMVRKQLENAGVNHEGKIRVKIITSKEALRRVAGGNDKFQILSSQETNQFRDLLSNLLGGNQQLMEEKKRQEVMENNYNLIWNENSFSSAAVSGEKSTAEQTDQDDSS